MGCFENRSAMTAMAFIGFFLLACEAGVVVSGDPSSSSAAKHGKSTVVRSIRKLLNITAAATASVQATEVRMVSASGCSEEAVEVSQAAAGLRPSGIPSYTVTITNACAACTVWDVHLSCGDFVSADVIDPSSFRRVAGGDCLVRGGGAMGPGETVSFVYANSFRYPLAVASVSCG